MGLFNKILHAGEGKKLKSLESIVPAVGAFEPEMQRRSDDELRALTHRRRGLGSGGRTTHSGEREA